MTERKSCFSALGVERETATARELDEKLETALAAHGGSAESERLARQLLRENHAMCLAELRGKAR